MARQIRRSEHRSGRPSTLRPWFVAAATAAGALAVAAGPASALLSGAIGGSADPEGHATLEVTPPDLPELPELPEAPEAPPLPDLAEPDLPELPDPGDGGGSGFPVPLPAPGDGGLPVPVPEIPAGPGPGTAVVDVEAHLEAGGAPPPASGIRDGGSHDAPGDGAPDDGGQADVEVDARVGLDVTSEGALSPPTGGDVPEPPLDGTPLEALDPALLVLLLENPELATDPKVLEAALGQTPAGDVFEAVPVPAAAPITDDTADDPVLARLMGSLPDAPAGTAAPITGTGLAGLGALGLYQLKRRFLG